MTHNDVAAALEYLGISVNELARATGETRATCFAWTSGEAAAPRWLDCLLHAWCERPELVDQALEGATAHPDDAIGLVETLVAMKSRRDRALPRSA